MKVLIDLSYDDYKAICEGTAKKDTITSLTKSVKNGALTTDIVSAVMKSLNDVWKIRSKKKQSHIVAAIIHGTKNAQKDSETRIY